TGHISHTQPALHRLCSIDIQVESLPVIRLLNAHINSPADLTQFLSNGIGHLLVDLFISSDNLSVQRSRKSEVNCFANDVCRQEVEGCTRGVAVQTETQITDIIRCRLMVGLQ